MKMKESRKDDRELTDILHGIHAIGVFVIIAIRARFEEVHKSFKDLHPLCILAKDWKLDCDPVTDEIDKMFLQFKLRSTKCLKRDERSTSLGGYLVFTINSWSTIIEADQTKQRVT